MIITNERHDVETRSCASIIVITVTNVFVFWRWSQQTIDKQTNTVSGHTLNLNSISLDKKLNMKNGEKHFLFMRTMREEKWNCVRAVHMRISKRRKQHKIALLLSSRRRYQFYGNTKYERLIFIVLVDSEVCVHRTVSKFQPLKVCQKQFCSNKKNFFNLWPFTFAMYWSCAYERGTEKYPSILISVDASYAYIHSISSTAFLV